MEFSISWRNPLIFSCANIAWKLPQDVGCLCPDMTCGNGSNIYIHRGVAQELANFSIMSVQYIFVNFSTFYAFSCAKISTT